MSNFSILLSHVVEPNFCVGCGACVSVCDNDTIAICFDSTGKYEPYYNNETACTSCGQCEKVCPFLSGNSNEYDIGVKKFAQLEAVQHTEEAGFFLDSYVGFADKYTRLNGASGGGLSEILKWLLETGQIDKVVTVESTNNPEKFFHYTIVDTAEGIDRCAKSAYYPVEINSVLKTVRRSKNERFAIVALPCVAKAVELAKEIFPSLRNNIMFVFGIVCGQTKTKKFAEFLIEDMKIKKDEVRSICFRKKVPDCPSSNFAFEVTKNDESRLQKMWTDGYGDVWTNDFAKLNSCYYCDDVFAECCDAVFMDAWLPEYTIEYEGTNLAINRNEKLTTFFEHKNYSNIGIERATESQTGVIRNKRAFRSLYTELAKPDTPPPKRNFSTQFEVSRGELLLQKQKFVWARESRHAPVELQQKIVNLMRHKSLSRQFKDIIKVTFHKLRVSR